MRVRTVAAVLVLAACCVTVRAESLRVAQEGNALGLVVTGATTGTVYSVVLSVDGGSTRTAELTAAGPVLTATAAGVPAGIATLRVTWPGGPEGGWSSVREIPDGARYAITVDATTLQGVLAETFTGPQVAALVGILRAEGTRLAAEELKRRMEWRGAVRDAAGLDAAIRGAGYSSSAVTAVRGALVEARARERVAAVEAEEAAAASEAVAAGAVE